MLFLVIAAILTDHDGWRVVISVCVIVSSVQKFYQRIIVSVIKWIGFNHWSAMMVVEFCNQCISDRTMDDNYRVDYQTYIWLAAFPV